MRHSYRIDPQSRIVYLTWEAGNTYQDWEALVQTVLADPAFETGFNFLSDRRAAGADPPDMDYANRALGFFKSYSSKLGPCKWAVVTADITTYGMTRMVSMRAEMAAMTVAVQGFDDYEKARSWLLH